MLTAVVQSRLCSGHVVLSPLDQSVRNGQFQLLANASGSDYNICIFNNILVNSRPFKSEWVFPILSGNSSTELLLQILFWLISGALSRVPEDKLQPREALSTPITTGIAPA
jgi:hypothetical protein